MSWFAWIIPLVWAAMYLFIKLPVPMILAGGIIGSVLLLVVVFAAVNFYKSRAQIMPSGILYKIAFVISVLSIISIGVYGLVQLFSK